jgi:hypothetical protein
MKVTSFGVLSALAIILIAVLYQFSRTRAELDVERSRREVLEVNEARLQESFAALKENIERSHSTQKEKAEVVQTEERSSESPIAAAKPVRPAELSAKNELERLYINTALRRQYAPLFLELDLSREDQELLLQLLGSRYVTSSEAKSQTVGVGDSAIEQSRLDEKLLALLGPDRYEKYTTFESSLYGRDRVNKLDAGLVTLGLGMSTEQRSRLGTIINEEYKSVPFVRDETLDPLETLERRIAWMDKVDQRVLERAATVLTSDQLSRVQADLSSSAAERHAALKLQLERRQAGESTGFVWEPAS